MDDSFTDLRLNQRGMQGEDSFWPSFTDIMTVIVMIFMLAMVILLLRNMELLNQLRSTTEAEQQAVELARTTGEENATLEEQLFAREYELSMLRMQMMHLEERAQEREAEIASQRDQLATAKRQRDMLDNQVAKLHRKSDQLGEQLTLSQSDSERLKGELEQANKRKTVTLSELETLRLSFSSQEKALTAALASNMAANQALSNLKTDFSDLKIKYDRLIRPARTAKGKTLVEVRYAKSDGQYQIDYRGPGQSGFQRISRKTLEQKMDRLKQGNSNLYVKVILPKNSGLSYSEAWSFTNHLHKRYDYYFQQEAQRERIVE